VRRVVNSFTLKRKRILFEKSVVFYQKSRKGLLDNRLPIYRRVNVQMFYSPIGTVDVLENLSSRSDYRDSSYKTTLSQKHIEQKTTDKLDIDS